MFFTYKSKHWFFTFYSMQYSFPVKIIKRF